jgi:hypothetical protein
MIQEESDDARRERGCKKATRRIKAGVEGWWVRTGKRWWVRTARAMVGQDREEMVGQDRATKDEQNVGARGAPHLAGSPPLAKVVKAPIIVFDSVSLHQTQ